MTGMPVSLIKLNFHNNDFFTRSNRVTDDVTKNKASCIILGTLSIGDDEVFGRRPEVAEVT